MSGRPSDRARRWLQAFEAGGLDALVAAIRTDAVAAPPADLAPLVRALRYLHQALLPPDTARSLGLAMELDETAPSPPAPARLPSTPPAPSPPSLLEAPSTPRAPRTPRIAALELERARLEQALAAFDTLEGDLLAAAEEHERMRDQEQALEDDIRVLEARLAGEGRDE